MITIKKLSSSIIIMFWLIMMGLLIRRTLIMPVTSNIPEVISEGSIEPGEEWSGIYFKDVKIGYTSSNRQKIEHGYYFSEEAVMDLSIMNIPQRITTIVHAKTDSNLLLRTFSFKLQSGIISFTAAGVVSGKQMNVTINTGGVIEKKELQLFTLPSLENSLNFSLVKAGLTPGLKIKRTIFDPFSMASREIIAEVERREEISIKDKKYDCYRIKQSLNGITVYSWINDKAETIREESPMGFLLIQEPRDVATSGMKHGNPMDITAATGIKVNRPIPDSNLSYLKIRLRNIPLEGFMLNSGRQKLENNMVEITRERVVESHSYTIPFTDNEFKEHLQETVFIQSGSTEIQNLANKVINKEKDALKVVMRFKEWVYTNIEKVPTISIPSALEVVRTRRGDCNEHAVLFTALCRAAGIPARICAGIVYQGGGFYYHAWVEVYLNTWLTVDPVMNQLPADVTHVKFVEGDLEQQLAILKVVGKLAIDVLEYT